MPDIYSIFLVFFISLLVASFAHQPIMRFAKKYHYYDNPEARKLQRRPVPVMGGLAVFIGAMAGSLTYWFKYNCISIVPVQVAMLVMLVIGGWDDIKKISPFLRLVFEVVIVVFLAFFNGSPINDFHGLWGIHEISPWIAWPLTVFACVGIINAINMIDGIDGLSSGFCIMAFGFFGLLFFYSHDYVHTALAVSIIGGLIPFFIMNVFGEKSKMYIGDAGTMMLGVALCEMVMAILTKGSLPSAHLRNTDFCLIAFCLAVVAIPVFDTLRVMFGRISRGASPLLPDKTHLHHAFIDYGFHHLETSLMELILNMMIIGVWWMFYKSHFSEAWQLYAVIVSAIGVCFGLYWMLGRKKRIARRIREKYGLTVEEYEQLLDEGKELKPLHHEDPSTR